MRIRAGDISLNYELQGKGKTLSLIHGMGNDLSVWEQQVPRWSEHYRVLAYDVRGHGQSDGPPGPYSIQQFAEDHHMLLKALAIGSNFVLGFSMGGVIALQFALDHPEMTDGLIVVSSSSEVSEKAASMYEQMAALIEQRGMQAIAGLENSIFAPEFIQRNPGVVAEYGEKLLRNDPKGYAAAARAVSRYNLTPELGKISCSSLLIVGDKDTTVGVGGSVIMSRRIANSKLVIVPGAGHVIMKESAGTLTNEVLDFLAPL